MGLMDGIFGRRDRVAIDPIALFRSGQLRKFVEDEFAINTLYQSAVDRVVSRASKARFVCKANPGIDAQLKRLGAKTNEDFFAAVVQDMMVQGWAVLYRSAGKWRVGVASGSTITRTMTDRTSAVPRGFRIRIQTDLDSGTDLEFDGMSREVCVITWRPQSGLFPYEPASPLNQLADIIGLQEETIGMLYDYAVNANAIAGVLQQQGEMGGGDDSINEMMAAMADKIKELDRFTRLGSPGGIEFKDVATKAAPGDAAMDRVRQEIAAFTGVPMELIAGTAQRQDSSSVEAHLIADSVGPILDRIAGALTLKLCSGDDEYIEWDPTSVMRPSIGGMAKAMLSISQGGFAEINELREMAGLPAKDIYNDTLPNTAGAGDRMETNPSPSGGGVE